ncbi:HAMP domain-containing sensor histidine kinase [Methylomonas sp. AM2-LC]|uniref:sensor histidine kinase n=1 Tax=Methylomonas sp. AM2-LC TaxID=3153301 RepID=UPI003266D88B
MSSVSTEIIYPCPLTKAYGIPSRQAWQLLKVFLVYRSIVALLFVCLYFLDVDLTQGHSDKQLYQFTCISYLAISILAAFFILRKTLSYPSLAQILIFTDILFIPLLMHACGGINSGIGILLTISLAAGGLLIGGRCAMLLAALASMTVLAEQIYAITTHNFNSNSLTYSGMLGVSFFSVVILSYMLAKRSEHSDQQEKLHSITIARLEELNRYIIQHMQSGIVIIDEQQNIRLSNQSTLRLLNLVSMPTRLAMIDPGLHQAFELWIENPSQNFSFINLTSGKKIQVRFALLNMYNEHLHMLTFEDNALYNQRLQKSKLASLGRLTASIAHEIRNPLGAISHAAQLLPESANLQTQDLRLIEIIQNNTQRVNRIIEAILNLSRRNDLQRQRISLDTWLPDYLDEQAQSNNAYRDHFDINFKVHGLNVSMDPFHLKQIMDNLCENALRYGKPDTGNILLEVDRINEAPCIKVIDNGPGIAPENLQQLFEPFFTTSHQGTGLGLYISRELAELNQAQLTYSWQATQACFTLTFADADLVVIEL